MVVKPRLGGGILGFPVSHEGAGCPRVFHAGGFHNHPGVPATTLPAAARSSDEQQETANQHRRGHGAKNDDTLHNISSLEKLDES